MKPLKYLMVATGNKGKAKEIAEILAPFGVTIKTLADVDDPPEIVEDGDTFEANARKKAVEVFERYGIPVLADDSGLVVDALDGAPGVFSARYSGKESTDEKNNAKLLAELERVGATTPESRKARFVCAMVFVSDEGELVSFGTVEGQIALKPSGTNGFGYDPLFFIPEKGRTAAELAPEEKNAISHRGKALRAMVEKLKEFGFIE